MTKSFERLKKIFLTKVVGVDMTENRDDPDHPWSTYEGDSK